MVRFGPYWDVKSNLNRMFVGLGLFLDLFCSHFKAFEVEIGGVDGSFWAILRCEKQPQPNVCQVGVGFGPMLWPLESLCWANWGSKWFVLGHIGM